MYNLVCYADNTTPRLFRRTITGDGFGGKFHPSDEDKDKLQSTAFLKSLDLISEGPIEGFCDATGKLVQGAGILKGIYLNDTPIQLTTNDVSQAGIYNFRNISLAFKRGNVDQSPFYVNQGETGETQDDDFYWLEDFSYSSQTISKNVPLDNQVELEEDGDGLGKRITSQTTHSVLDEDVDWIGVTININECYTIDKAGEQQPNKGKIMIWGDITGITHRSLDDGVVEEIIPDGFDDYNVLMDIQGLALSQYKEDVFLKLIDPKDLSGPRPRQVFIRNVTAQSYNFKSKFSASLDSVTEIVDQNMNYPNSAMVASLINAENFGSSPTRSFDMKLKRVKVPSNYVEKWEDEKGPTNLRAYASSRGSKGSAHTSEERHEGDWDGTFKDELEWTDNPAWILNDILTNDVYGLGEYIRDVNLDKWELYKIAKYCDELVPTSIPVYRNGDATNSFKQERRFSCNMLLQNPSDAYQAVNEICSIFRGIAYFNNLEIFVSMNAYKNSIFKFTNDSVLEGNFSYGGTPKHSKFTAVKVAYKDKEDSFLTKYEYVEDPEGISRYGWNQKELTAVGCTSRDQALRLARWTLLTSVLEEETVSFTTDRQAEHLEPGHVFTIHDELRNGFKVGGRVKEIVNDNSQPSKNYVLLDQKLDLSKNYKSISFLIPTEDTNLAESEHYIEFIHRNGKYIGSADGGIRDWDLIPINSDTSPNTNLNNYFEVTTSGTKILTRSDEDLIQRSPKINSQISASAGYKTFNDYFLDSDVLAGMIRGNERKNVTTKLKDGSLYILHGDEDETFDEKEYQLISKTENQDGTYSLVATEYSREKFGQTDSLSTIYTARTVPYDPTPANRPSAGGGPLPQFDDDPDDNTQVQNLGAPEKNTIEVIVVATGYVNSEGISRSRVNYFIHNVEENAAYYNPDVTNFGNYYLRLQRVTEEYYRSLVVTKMGNEGEDNILQNNEWKVPGLRQKCGSNRVLWDLSLGDERDKARVGGSNNLQVTLPNYIGSKFTPFLEVQHPRYEYEIDDLEIDGCPIFTQDAYEQRITGAVSGEFELPDANAYYELRWSEANDFGRSEEKVMFFRGEPDLVPPDPPDHFNVSLNPLFPNNLSFRWENESPDRELDLIGFRLYTGWVGGDVPEFENTNLGEDAIGGYNEYRLPKIGSSFTEVIGKYASHTVYEADTSRGSFADLNGNALGIGTNAMFHIRAFDVAGNFSDPRNSNLISLFDVAVAPDLYLSGEIREEGKGTDTYRQSPILHAFYSGQFHNDRSFKKYFLKINDETFGVSNHSINIFQEDIKTAPAQYGAGSSGHLEIREVTANTEYFGKLSAFTSENRESLVATSTATIGKDNFAPLKIQNFKIRKQFSDFEFSWDPPPEADCNRVLLYTGVGKDNFGEVTDGQNKISQIAKNQGGLIASVNKDDRPVFPISRFEDVIQYKNAATTYPFHVLPVDTSDNTGVYTDAEFKTVDMSPPILHTSGTVNEDGQGLVHVFYSGVAQDDSTFQYYLTEYKDINSFDIKTFQGKDKAAYNDSDVYGGSGHFVFQANGNTFYDVKTRIVLSKNETDWATDTILSNEIYDVVSDHVYVPRDSIAPEQIKNFLIRKQFSDFEFLWDVPPEPDCNRVLLYTGLGKDNFGEISAGQNKLTTPPRNTRSLIASVNKDDRPVFPISQFKDVEVTKNAATTYPFHVVPADTSDNTGIYKDGSFTIVDMSPPQLHTSGTVDADGRSVVHVFYSGVAQDDDTFQYYLTEYKDINSFDIKTFQGKDKANYNDSDIYGGSGHFVFEANGNTFYDIKTRIVLSKNETDWATDTILSNKFYGVTSDNLYVPRDSKPPEKLERFRVSKEWSNFRFSWDEPKENDVVKVLLYTGIGRENFNFTPEEEDSKIKIENLPVDYSHPFASVLPDDAPTFAIDKFNKPGSQTYENTKWYFHALAVDSSNNTGMYVDTSFEYVNLDGPEVHTSGEITSDGRSVIHVFYSGQEQNDDSFRYYFTEYQNVEEMTLLGQRDSTKAFHNPGVLGEGSGHYVFEAKGDSYYEVRVKSVFDIFQSNWADDTILTNKHYDIKAGYEDYIYAAPDNIPPGTPTWISSQKNGNNIFLSWENPDDHDLEHIHLYTGTEIATVSADGYSFSDQKKVAIHQSTIAISDVIPLKDFSANAGKKFYFWLQAEDTSNNKGKISDVRLVDVGRTEALYRDEVRCTTGIINDDGGDGTSYAFINYLINDDPLNRQHLSYTVQLSKRPSFNPLIGTQEIPVQYSDDDDDLKVRYPGRNIGSGIFSNLEANQTYYLRARINEHDGKQSQWTLSYDNPIKTPKDSTLPKIPNNFNIISGPKQIFLEWDWDEGISKDTDSILVYKTGIPTGIVKEESVQPTLNNPNTNCWKMSHISGYFFENPELYTYKLSASTSYIDNDVETGINGESIYYFYFLRTLDKSDNLSKQFVSGISRDVHNYYPVNKAKTIFSNEANLAFGQTPHTQGYVTGGAISADYISNIYASRILTDRITATDFILSHPSGRVLSDNVYTRAIETPEYGYAIGKGVYLDHKMFRIGDPSPGGYGLFWTGHKEYIDSDFTKPTFSKDPDGFHAIDIDPNTLEIRGNLTAGTIEIGASRSSAFNVDSEGNLTIGNQTKEISGFFKGELGVSGIFGETYEGYDYDDQYSSVFVQIETDHLTAIEKAAIKPGVYLETNWKRGPFYYGWEIAQVESFNQSNGILKLELPGLEYNGFDFYDLFGNEYGLSGVTTTGSRDWDSNNVPAVRDYWRIHDAKFKVTKDGSLFAADAKILGTAKADALEVGTTIVLGDTYNSYSSVIQSYNFDDDFNPCDPTEDARGWKIVGDGTAYFKSIDIRSGLLSGSMGLIIGNGCYDNAFFRVTSKGDISIGRSLVYNHNPFYVSREGNLFAQDAEFRGDLNISGRVDVGDGMRFGSHVTRDKFGTVISATDEDGILINRFGLQSTNFQHGADKGFQLTQNGKAILHNLAVTGGWISGANLLIGRGSRDNPWFKAFSNGDISLGDYEDAQWTTNGSLSTAATAPSKHHPFFVSRKGTLKTKDAYIIGDVGISGNVDVGDGIRFGSVVTRDEYGNVTSVQKDTRGILINSSAMRSINYQTDWDGTTKSFYLGADGETILHDLAVRGGSISGVNLLIGRGTRDQPWFKAFSNGDISLGDYVGAQWTQGGSLSTATTAPSKNHPFFVSRKGTLKTKDAYIIGDVGISGNVDVGDGIRFGSVVNRDAYGNVTSVQKDTNGILINSSAMRSINYQTDWDGTTKSFYLGADGETILSDLVVRGGNISGVKMMIGKGTSSEPWLKVWDDGEISVGSYGYNNRNRAPKNTDPFYVDKQGSMWAQNAYVKGTITGRYGRVGSLIMDPDWLSTSHPDYDVPRTSNNLQTITAGAHNAITNPYRVGWYINSEGHFSVVNEAGKLFGWAGENKYLTVTGLASSSNENAIYETTRHPSNYDPPDPNTYGKGFLLQGEHMGGWISNFRTDPKSAWGIANQVITCIHGDIRLPILNDLYTILSNSPIGYFVSGIYLETDVDNATVRFTKNDPQASVPSILGPADKLGNFKATKAGYYTTLSNTNKIEPGANKDSYLVAKPTSVGSNTSIRFRIDLYRQGSYTKNIANENW